MIEPPTREELILDMIAPRKAMSHLRNNLNTTRDLCWAAHLSGQDIPGRAVLDIIGWPIESEGTENGP